MSRKIVISNSDIKKLMQEGGLPTNRLPSFVGKKDLTLGAVRPKRTYLPNFHAVPKKQVGEVKKNDSVKKPSLKNTSKKKNFKNNKEGKYVETEGLFSNGIGEALSIRRAGTANMSTAKERENINAMTAPKISFSDLFIKEENDERFKGFEIDDPNDEIGDFHAHRSLNLVTNLDPEEMIMKDIKKQELDTVKKEVETARDQNEEKNSASNELPNMISAFTLPNKTFSEGSSVLSLFNFPSFIMEGKKSVNLKDVPEGYLGKLVTRKSGKIEMVINNFRYAVTQQDISNLYQHQLMLFPGAQSMARENNSVVNLGVISEKYTVALDSKNFACNEFSFAKTRAD